jgi:ABC-type branched-subunit amino acid transport system substrate-binding protein
MSEKRQHSIKVVHWLLGVGLTTALLAFSGACSLVTKNDAKQCTKDSECEKIKSGLVCQSNVCVSGQAGGGGTGGAGGSTSGTSGDGGSGPTQCSTTQDCLAQVSQTSICRKTDGLCVEMKTSDCGTILGPYKKEDAVIIGALVPLFGPGTANGPALTHAIDLAVRDFQDNGGIPTAGAKKSKSLAVLICDNHIDSKRAIQHLTANVGAKVIIGAANKEGRAATIAANGVHITPYLQTNAGDPSGKVWQLGTSAAIEGGAIARVVSEQLTPILQTAGVANPQVTIINRGDEVGISVGSAVKSALNSQTNPILPANPLNYGDPETLSPSGFENELTIAVQQATNAKSNIVVLIGQVESIKGILDGIESNWPNQLSRPYYVLSSGLQDTVLLNEISERDDLALRARILTVSPGINTPMEDPLGNFSVRFKNTFKDGTEPFSPHVQAMFDAFYFVAYAYAGTETATDPTGEELIQIFPKLQTGTATLTIPTTIKTTVGEVQKGTAIDLVGVSGSLNFDSQTQQTVEPIQVYCPVKNGTTFSYQHAGLSFTSGMNTLTGTLSGNCLK